MLYFMDASNSFCGSQPDYSIDSIQFDLDLDCVERETKSNISRRGGPVLDRSSKDYITIYGNVSSLFWGVALCLT